MEKIKFDSGVREYDLGTGGVLRFNPGDPNLYARFMDAAEKFRIIEQEMTEQAKQLPETEGSGIFSLLQETDKKLKEVLRWVFGWENDFDQILGGVNLLAVGANGRRVASNLLDALQPILLAGAKACAKEKAQEAVAKAQARRKRV